MDVSSSCRFLGAPQLPWIGHVRPLPVIRVAVRTGPETLAIFTGAWLAGVDSRWSARSADGTSGPGLDGAAQDARETQSRSPAARIDAWAVGSMARSSPSPLVMPVQEGFDAGPPGLAGGGKSRDLGDATVGAPEVEVLCDLAEFCQGEHAAHRPDQSLGVHHGEDVKVPAVGEQVGPLYRHCSRNWT